MYHQDQISVDTGAFAECSEKQKPVQPVFYRSSLPVPFVLSTMCSLTICGECFTGYYTTCSMSLFQQNLFSTTCSYLRNPFHIFWKLLNCNIDFFIFLNDKPVVYSKKTVQYTQQLSLIKRECVSFQQGGVLQSNYRRLHDTARSITVKVFKPCHYGLRL